jgi:hypothetical protein
MLDRRRVLSAKSPNTRSKVVTAQILVPQGDTPL